MTADLFQPIAILKTRPHDKFSESMLLVPYHPTAVLRV